MASKYLGAYQVTAQFVKDELLEDVQCGDWVLVSSSNVGYPYVVAVDDNRRDAMDNLKQSVYSDYYVLASQYLYELWHVVETPDWLNVSSFDSIALVERRNHPLFEETLVYLKGDDFPYGLAVLVTPWAYYTVKDWQGQQPVSIRDLDNFECVETCAAMLPSRHIDAFVDFCENMVNDIDLLSWNDLRRFELRLYRLDNLI